MGTLHQRALLRHGISIWIDVPLDLVAKGLEEERIQLSASDTSIFKSSSSESMDQMAALYNSGRNGYSTADATISLQKLASQLGYDELDAVTAEDMCVEVLNELEKLMRVKKMMEEAARPFSSQVYDPIHKIIHTLLLFRYMYVCVCVLGSNLWFKLQYWSP